MIIKSQQKERLDGLQLKLKFFAFSIYIHKRGSIINVGVTNRAYKKNIKK